MSSNSLIKRLFFKVKLNKDMLTNFKIKSLKDKFNDEAVKAQEEIRVEENKVEKKTKKEKND